MDHLEEIKFRISIEDLVGGYVQLKKAGRNLRGLCPFHGEKTPSFMVSPEKGIAYCFGCHQGGDIFKFTQLVENVSFGEAVKILAEKAGVRLPRELPKEQNKKLKTIEINEKTMEFWQKKLEEHPEHRRYFLNRGLTEETIQTYRLGYAPDAFDQLKNHLISLGFDPRDLLESGVLSQRSIADQSLYDRFRHRLMFPIFDSQGNPVGFSGRVIGEGEPKYMNSPETPAYNKSMILYGLHWAKESIKAENRAIIMEGFMDVIASHQAGTKNAVATCGTALTPQQLKLIKRYTDNVIFCFDSDSAGQTATLRGIELAEGAELNLKVLRVPEGKDPDECIQKNPDEWKKAVENPLRVMDFYFEYAAKRYSPETMEGKRELMDFLLPLIRIYKSDVERGDYLNRLALTLKTDVRLLWNDLNKIKKTPKREENKASQDPSSASEKKTFPRETFLLGLVLLYPELYPHVANNLIETIPLDPSTEKFYKALKTVYTRESSIGIDCFSDELSAEEKERLNLYILLIEKEYPDFSAELAEKEVKKLIREINRKNLHVLQKEYEYKIRLEQNPYEQKLLLGKYNELLKLNAKI